MPLISVIMPVKNGEAYIAESLESLLVQTFKDFEIVIVDDQSADNTLKEISKFTSPNLKVVSTSPENSGLVSALNYGILSSNGEFIARLDSDDLSSPNRLEVQIQKFRQNPELGLCGSWAETFGSIRKPLRYPLFSPEIKAKMVFSNPFAHSTVMFKREALPEQNLPYDPSYPVAEDYKLWSDISKNWEVSNIPQILMKYRVHDNQVSQTKSETRLESVAKIQSSLLQQLGIVFSEEELKRHTAMSSDVFYLGKHLNQFASCVDWLAKINSVEYEPFGTTELAMKQETRFQLKQLLKYVPLTPAKMILDSLRAVK